MSSSQGGSREGGIARSISWVGTVLVHRRVLARLLHKFFAQVCAKKKEDLMGSTVKKKDLILLQDNDMLTTSEKKTLELFQRL